MTNNLRSISQFAEENPAFTEPAIRWYIFKEKENGLAALGAVVRIGRRVYIDRQKFSTWVENQQSAA